MASLSLSRVLVLLLVSASTLAVPRPLRVQVAPGMEDDDGSAAELADGEDGDDASAEADSTGTRPVAILEHRQELQDDGTFNYAFSADNGLTQNEAFHPDGSRTGSYSYVDPKGETILVKYRADRFGFHVLDGSTIPSTPPHVASAPAPAPAPRGAPQQAASDYASRGVQGVLDPNYFGFPSSGGLKTSPSGTSGKVKAAVKAGKAGVKAGVKGSKSAARARSSASSSMHFLQREAREAFVSDLDGDVDVDESRLALRTVRAPPGMASPASANDVDAGSDGSADDHHALKYDDGNYDAHATKYDDGSYDTHAAKYDDGSYEPHAAKYDDGSYEPHAAKYDDGSYTKHAGLYDDGSYEPHAAKYDDGSYEKYARMYDDGSYKGGGEGEGESGVHEDGDGDGYQ
ncbi:uncharacterized protein LOC117640854 [Thrips palmi]|uniref:Uncharacterized protein LOC117640854 n=1 Tax=Thrips palmi TaxID=161013 RepID=A0A6P8YIA3_THRPL|nr:uncharacterized protein LOC117640854 [Thrips palmi]